MKIAVASGKGGTGKTTVSVNLARVFNNNVASGLRCGRTQCPFIFKNIRPF